MNGKVVREHSYNIQCRFCSVFDRVTGVPKQRDCERHWRAKGWRKCSKVGWVCSACLEARRDRLQSTTPKPQGAHKLARELLRAGMSPGQVALELNVSKSTVQRWTETPEQKEKRVSGARLWRKNNPEKRAAQQRRADSKRSPRKWDNRFRRTSQGGC
jgi:transposase-like protein